MEGDFYITRILLNYSSCKHKSIFIVAIVGNIGNRYVTRAVEVVNHFPVADVNADVAYITHAVGAADISEENQVALFQIAHAGDFCAIFGLSVIIPVD